MTNEAPTSKPELDRSSLTETDIEGDTDKDTVAEPSDPKKHIFIHAFLCCLLLLPLLGGILYFLLNTPESNNRLSPSIGALEGTFTGNSSTGIVFQPSTNIQPNNIGEGSSSSLVNSRSRLSNFDFGANTFLSQGQAIQQDTRLALPKGYYLQQQSDGNLILYDSKFKVYWNSGVIRAPSAKRYWTTLQGDGNLVTYSKINNGGPIVEWASNSPSSLNQGYSLVLAPSANGLMIVRRKDGQIIWSTVTTLVAPLFPEPGPSPSPPAQQQPPASTIDAGNRFLKQGQVLRQGERLYSSDRGIYFEQQQNGNLVLYNKKGRTLWNSGVNRGGSNFRTVLQGDGNLVTLANNGRVDWSSGSSTPFNGEYNLKPTPNSDGLMITRPMDGHVIWSTVPVDPQPPLSPWPRTVSRSRSYTIQSGPLVGHTTHDSAKIWVYLGRNVAMQVVYWPYSNKGEMRSVSKVTLTPDSKANGAAFRTIGGLTANTIYLYEVRINNEWLAQGHFKTAPSPRRPTSFKYLLASCMNVKTYNEGYKQQPVWYEALKRNIDFAMLPGDTVYLNHQDFTSRGEVRYDRIWHRNLQQRAETHFAHLIKTVPTYSQWDNNDFGSQNADHSQRGKWNSLAAWGHLWQNPYQGSSKGAGNYYSYSWGEVDFFVLDCRWYRNKSRGILFGNAQLEWLSEKLIASSAKFKVIVSSSGVLEIGMTRDAHTIGKVISQHRISGVLFNTGDIHRNQFTSQNVAHWPYPLVQITSSGIAKVWRRPFALITVNTNLHNPEIKAEFFAADSGARFTTWSNNPNLQCRHVHIHDEHRMSKCTQRIRLSDLTPR